MWRVSSFGLVDVPVLPRPECRLAGLASLRTSVLVCLSDGEAGETLVDFLAGSFSESLDFYVFLICACLGDGEADETRADV